jgi:hypothetical protein
MTTSELIVPADDHHVRVDSPGEHADPVSHPMTVVACTKYFFAEMANQTTWKV